MASSKNVFASICVLGMSRSGKTVLLKALLQLYSSWPTIYVSATARFSHELQLFVNRNEPDRTGKRHAAAFTIKPCEKAAFDELKDLVRSQEEFIDGLQLRPLRAEQIETEKKKRRILLVFDDCVSDSFDKRFVANLLTKSRHLLIKCVIATQSIKANLTPTARFNVHLLFLGNVNRETLEFIYCMTGFNKMGELVTFYDQNRRDFHFIIFNVSDPRAPRYIINSDRLRLSLTVA